MSQAHDETTGPGTPGPPPDPSPHKRLDVFIIDTGWNAAVSAALMKNLNQIRVYLQDDFLSVVDQPRSIALLKANPHLIGHDPMILFFDRRRKDAGHERYGLRLNL